MERKNLKNFDQIKIRLLQFAESQKIPKTKFFEQNQLAASNFSGKGAESALSTDKIVQILTCFPELNSDWLLLGRGEMLRSDAQKTVSSSADSVPWSRYDAAQQEIGALRTRLEQSAETVARLLKENADLRKNPVSPSPVTPKAPILI